jgi:hypothetical protein
MKKYEHSRNKGQWDAYKLKRHSPYSREKPMSGIKILALGVVLGVLAGTPAFADCASAMKENDAMMMKASDTAKKDSAMKEQNMAKEMMDKKDEAGCMMHANKAMEMMK